MNWNRKTLGLAALALVMSILILFAIRPTLPGWLTRGELTESDPDVTATPNGVHPLATTTTTAGALDFMRGWSRIRTGEQVAFYTRRRPGLKHLLIYAARQADGLAELAVAAPMLQEAGYDLISHGPISNASPILDPEPGGESARGVEEPLQGDSLREFLELGTSRHGYRERILTIYGAGLAAALEFVAANPRSISTLIILRPGDAWNDRRAIQATVASLPDELRILWVSSGRGYESGLAARLRYTVERQRPADSLQALNLPPLAAGRKAFELRLSETLLYELLQERLELEWLPASEVFAGGCGVYASGGGRLRLGATLVSAGRDYDFCPLFVRRAGQALFRAEAVGDERCTYRQADGRRRIYCAY